MKVHLITSNLWRLWARNGKSRMETCLMVTSGVSSLQLMTRGKSRGSSAWLTFAQVTLWQPCPAVRASVNPLQHVCSSDKRGFTGNLALTTVGEGPLYNNPPENRPNQDFLNIKQPTLIKSILSDLLRQRARADRLIECLSNVMWVFGGKKERNTNNNASAFVQNLLIRMIYS